MTTTISAAAATARDNARTPGGQFGHQHHTENPNVALTGPAETTPTDPWPEGFGVPQIGMVLSESRGIVVTYQGQDGSILEAWEEDGGGIQSDLYDGEGPSADQDEIERAAHRTFKQINQAGNTASDRGLLAFRHAILAEATGNPPKDDDLAAMVALSDELIRKAEKQRDLAAASLLARNIRRLHPEATQLAVNTGIDDDDVLYIESVTAFGANGDELGDYYPWDANGGLSQDAQRFMSLMTAHGGNAYWYDFVDLEDDHDGYRIDLDKAVNWVPCFE